jgi:hypothetical protein
MFCPCKLIAPLEAGATPEIALISVVLPTPFVPITLVTAPAWAVRFTLYKICDFP